ncbi:hypothetical protein [Paraburkholderia sp.]|uniref:hypothetical protein n=1 Tax=Paraburkholderia sp. TaxID=1926495 RepID=UPI003C7D51A2
MVVPKRLLVPDDQCIVVLDTSPARNLAHVETLPRWVETFAEMANSGYSFSLADGALAELLAQRSSGRIPDAGFEQMIAALARFLNPSLPVLPTKRDIEQMIGATDRADGWSEEVFDLSNRGWAALQEAKPELGARAEASLEEERISWFDLFGDLEDGWTNLGRPTDLDELDHPELYKALAAMDRGTTIFPPKSIRCDLQVRLLWRQFARSKRLKDPYDPASLKKINDGIDFDLYRYLQLPALVVAEDSGFFGKIENIPSFQRNWFWKPWVLAEAWVNGDKPLPKWPEVAA